VWMHVDKYSKKSGENSPPFYMLYLK
jgi:hypothetical protein